MDKNIEFISYYIDPTTTLTKIELKERVEQTDELLNLPVEWVYNGNEIFIGKNPDEFQKKYPIRKCYMGPVENKAKAIQVLKEHARKNIQKGIWANVTFIGHDEYMSRNWIDKIK